MAVDREEIEIPRISGDLKETQARRIFKVAHEDLFNFLDEVYGDFFAAGIGVVRSGLATYPGLNWLVFDGFDVEPMNDRITGENSAGVATTDAGVKVTLKYKTVPYEQDEEQRDPNNPRAYASHAIAGSFQVIEYPEVAVKWEEADRNGRTAFNKPQAIGVPVTIVEHIIKWHHVVKPPFEALYDISGKVNGTTFLGHGPEVVKLTSFEAAREVVPGGRTKWELTYNLHARIVPDEPGVGWNHFLQPLPAEGNKWVRVVHDDGDDSLLLPRADFGKLFELS